ncbi:MAG: response regulator, partial [Pseudomonadota bacterium]
MEPDKRNPAGEGDDLSILLVDDADLLLKLAARILRVLNLPVFTAANGREAWEFMHRKPADILITDIMMPEMNGFDLIRGLRQEPRFQQTYIVVMTALDRVEDKVKALELGANDYVVKPLEASEFRARVRTGVREMRLKRDLNRAMGLLDYELKLVAQLQRRLLPKSLPEGENFESAVLYLPA